MAKESGYRLIYRSAMEHNLIGCKKPFSRFEAWIWMILSAWGSKEKHLVYREFGGKERAIEEGYGQLTHSLRFMAQKWGWSPKRTKNFISALEMDKMLLQQVTQQITQITICNFEDYQQRGNSSDHGSDHSRETAEKQQRNSRETNKNTLVYTRAREGAVSPNGGSPRGGAYPQSTVAPHTEEFLD